MVEWSVVDVSLVEGRARRFGPSVPGIAPYAGPPREHSDELANRLAERWIAEPEFAMLALHDVDEAFGQRHRRGIAGLSLPLKANDHQGNNCRQHRKPPVDRVRHSTLAVPRRPPGFGADRIEQRLPARRFGG